MSTFLVSFRIEHTGNYNDRYNSLNDAITQSKGTWWAETTSYYVKVTSETIESFTSRLKKCINPQHDILLVLDANVKSGRICGAVEDQDIFQLLPFLKKA